MEKAAKNYIMLSVLLIFALTFISCQKKNTELDITEVIEKAQDIGDKYFSEDISGIHYDKNKPWLIYNKFIKNKDLTSELEVLSRLDSLENASSTTSELKDSLTIKETNRNKLINDYESIYKEKNDYYLVRINQPIKNNKRIYKTYLWINANKWRSGFQIYVQFMIEDKKAKVIYIKESTMSNVLEF